MDTQNIKNTKINYYSNPEGPVIGVSVKPVIQKDGLYFKDHTGDGELTVWKDWRQPPALRAESLAKELTAEEKLGLLFVDSWKMGIYQEDRTRVDESGLLDEEIVEVNEGLFNTEKTWGTMYTVRDLGIRHMILRQNPQPSQLAAWINRLNEVAEGTRAGVPMLVCSNSRNENGRPVLGMNDAIGVFTIWPGTLGLAAAVRGNDISLLDDFAECVRSEWDAAGMKKGYFYMADVMTDPRWKRSYGTFGEDPELTSAIIEKLISGIQGSSEGVTQQGIAMTVKHFPGGGARENGYDPHYAEGRWNVYQTEGSLDKYHLPAFRTAARNQVSSIMPYYAIPSAAKSKIQRDGEGREITLENRAFAYNREFIRNLLRGQIGFTGYVNSDSGITNKMAWGVEDLDSPSRVALAINNGVDIISGSSDVAAAREAYERGKNGYYRAQGNPVPEGYQAEELVLTDEALTRAAARTLKEQFALGLFENPYRDPEAAEKAVGGERFAEAAHQAHVKSVVMLKNKDSVLPLTPEKTKGKKIYAECFGNPAEAAEADTAGLREELKAVYGDQMTEDYTEADYALLFLNPKSGVFYHASSGLLVLDICENKDVTDVDGDGRPVDTTHKETTLCQAGKLKDIYEKVHRNGGKVIASINMTLAWELGNAEPYADALLAGFDTFQSAILEIIRGIYSPSGRLPITLPRNDEVLFVNKEGICISPNDVPGYDKDLYMPEHMKDENGKAYAYRDEEGNYYQLDFGLTY